MRSLAAEVVVDPSSAVAAEEVAIDSEEDPIAAVEAAGTGPAAGTARLYIGTACTAAGCCLAAAVADSLAVLVGPGSLVAVAAETALPSVELVAPSLWPCPWRRACRKSTLFIADVVECEARR